VPRNERLGGLEKEATMTSREHARRLMLILLSSQGGPVAEAETAGESGADADDCQDPEGRDDPGDGGERGPARMAALVAT
jgi:hypothetical protein